MDDKHRDQILNKLNNTVEYITTEYDITYDELVGMLEQIKHRILMEFYNENCEDNLCDDCRRKREELDDLPDNDLPPDFFDDLPSDEDEKE